MNKPFGEKLRNPTKSDIERSAMWLVDARHQLDAREFHKVKRLCKQVIRALRRKELEGK